MILFACVFDCVALPAKLDETAVGVGVGAREGALVVGGGVQQAADWGMGGPLQGADPTRRLCVPGKKASKTKQGGVKGGI